MDKVKEKIDYLKLWLTFLVTINVGSTAWLFNQAGKVSLIKAVIVFLFVLIITCFIGLIHKKTYRIIKNIGD